MTVRDMARLHGMNNPFNTWNRANSATATSANTAARAPAPDWSEIPTKETPKMSEEEFEQAIKDLARKEASEGILAGTEDQRKLMRDYISVVSPDRKSWFSSGASPAIVGGKDDPVKPRMHFNPNFGKWFWKGTPAENERMAKFHDIYQQAYQEYEAEHGKVIGTPTITQFDARV